MVAMVDNNCDWECGSLLDQFTSKQLVAGDSDGNYLNENSFGGKIGNDEKTDIKYPGADIRESGNGGN